MQDKDGYLTASDLTSALGHTEDVKQLIAAADRKGDGKLPLQLEHDRTLRGRQHCKRGHCISRKSEKIIGWCLGSRICEHQ